MNKKGHSFIIGLMFGFMGLLFALSVTPALKESVGLARTDMECTLTTLTAGEFGACIWIDWASFIFFGTVLAVAYSWISGKIQIGQIPGQP